MSFADESPMFPQRVGAYVLHAELARGGMGTVFLGEDPSAEPSRRIVAVKKMRHALARDADFVVMFRDEARIARRILHCNVVAARDLVHAGDDLCLVMEYVAGASLSAVLVQATPPPAIAASILFDVLCGLHAAHEAQDERGLPLCVVHRDVSPQNIIVGEDGAARITDFGIAHAAMRSQATTPGQVKGKLKYMAPEQLTGAGATRQSDIYSASVVLWEALTGQRLVRADEYGAIFGQVLEGRVVPPSTLMPTSKQLDTVVLRGLAKNSAARFATALEMAHALDTAIVRAQPMAVKQWLVAAAHDALEMRRAQVAAILHGDRIQVTTSISRALEEETPTWPRSGR